MALFSKADLDKPKYIKAILEDIKLKKPIRVIQNEISEEIIFEYNDFIKELSLIDNLENNILLYKRILYPEQKYSKIFTSNDRSFQFNNIDKSQYSNMGSISSKKSANSFGKTLSDAAEKATITSIEYHIEGKTILTPECTKQDFFIDNPNYFESWKKTFVQTPLIVDDITKSSLDSYEYIHDASRGHSLEGIINNITKLKGCSKDSWNPADMWVIKNNSLYDIEKEFTNVFSYDINNKDKLQASNNLIKDLYNDDYLYPISLKQIVGEGRYEKTNYNAKNYDYTFKMKVIPCDFAINESGMFLTKELGVFQAINLKTDSIMSFQVRSFPHGYRVAQTEITSSGEESGGRIGKVPAYIIDEVFEEYGYSRIKSIKELNDFKLSLEDKNKFIKMYENVLKSSNTCYNDIDINYFKENIDEWINKTTFDTEFKAILCIKLQGLIMADFLTNNSDNINEILTRFLLGAKKISQDSGFFIKIY